VTDPSPQLGPSRGGGLFCKTWASLINQFQKRSETEILPIVEAIHITLGKVRIIGGAIMSGESRSVCRKTCPSAIFSLTNPTCTVVRS
jgi:hypothetical protein